jgi:hypothetical protein
MGFDPVEGPRHYRARAGAAYFDAQREQRGAYELAATPPDVQAEIEKLQHADFVVIQFPLCGGARRQSSRVGSTASSSTAGSMVAAAASNASR